MIKSIVPNPFSKDSSLADLTKKAELIKEGLSFTIIIKNIIFLAVLGFILSKFFQIPLNIILILVGTEIIITLIAGYLKIIKLKAVYDINTANNDAKGYRTLIITSEYYELIKTIFGVIAHIFSIGLIFLFFHKEISNIVTSSIPLNQISLKYFVFIFLGFKIFDFFMKLVRYSWIKNIKESNNFDEVNQDYLIIEKKLELVKFIPFMFIFLVILFFLKVPFFIPLIFGGFMILMLILSIIELKM